MGKFIFWTLLFLIGGGFILHYHISIPGVSLFLGKLPGDITVTRGDLIIYFPIASAALLGLIISLLFYALKPQKKD